LRSAYGNVEGERVARAAAIAIGRDHGHCPERFDRLAERLQTLGAITVVVRK